jgi:hypothetical protein
MISNFDVLFTFIKNQEKKIDQRLSKKNYSVDPATDDSKKLNYIICKKKE